jgi:hypothetical protein
MAALQGDPRALLAATFRGGAGLEVPSFEALLERVDAVAICSPDSTHATYARKALLARKHVVVEFPVATSAVEARTLFALARRMGRILHVEHIELLTATCRALREHARDVKSGSVRFCGLPRPGPVALVNVARLHRVVDALGMPDGCHSWSGRGFLSGHLRYPWGKLALDFRHGDLGRMTEILLVTGAGRILQQNGKLLINGEPQELPEQPPLFAADQLVASARILDGAEHYISEERIVDVLRLVEALK